MNEENQPPVEPPKETPPKTDLLQTQQQLLEEYALALQHEAGQDGVDFTYLALPDRIKMLKALKKPVAEPATKQAPDSKPPIGVQPPAPRPKTIRELQEAGENGLITNLRTKPTSYTVAYMRKE